MKGIYTLFIVLIALASNSSIGATEKVLTIGSGTATSPIPFGMFWGYERSAGLYMAEEISIAGGTSGNITKLGWHIQSLANSDSCNVKIYLKNTSDKILIPADWSEFTDGAELVYDNVPYFSAGWQIFELTKYFSYDGTSNLLVLVETNHGGSGSESGTAMKIEYSITPSNQHESWGQDNYPPLGVDGGTSTHRPNLQITLSNSQTRVSEIVPEAFTLFQNFPNPFNPNTTLIFRLSERSHITLVVFDVLGQKIATLVDGMEEPGYKSIQFEAGSLAGGMYFCRLQTDQFSQTRRLLLLK
jgi:hypothetical protein